MTLEVAGRVSELGEDQDLLVVQRLRLEQADELLQLVVVLRLEFPGLIQELHDLVEVEERLEHHLLDVVLGPVEELDRVEHLLGDDIFVVPLLAFLAPEIELALDGEAQDVGVLCLPPLEALLLGVALAVDHDEGQQLLEQAVAGELEGRATELSKRLRKLVRMRPTTCFWRFSSNGSMSLSGPMYQCSG